MAGAPELGPTGKQRRSEDVLGHATKMVLASRAAITQTHRDAIVAVQLALDDFTDPNAGRI